LKIRLPYLVVMLDRRSRLPGEAPLFAYALGLAVVALAITAALLSLNYTITSPWLILVLAVTAAAAERGTVRLSSTVEVSIGLLPTLFTAVVFGPLASMLVSACSMLGDIRRNSRVPLQHLRWSIYTCSRALTGAAAGLAATGAGKLVQNEIGAIAAATAVGALVLGILDVLFVSTTMKLRGERMVDSLRTLVPMSFSSSPVFAPVVALLAVAYQEVSPWTLPLFLAPALAAQRLSALYQEQRRLAEDLAIANDRLERANLSFATALVATLEARDRYTAGHSASVARFAAAIAAQMNLTEDEQQLAQLCGLVHDIGKIGLSAGLLEKVGSLSVEERRQMEEHSAIGERILANVDDYSEIASIVRHHHERVDGRGYPDGLEQDEIPLLARIISVADAYDAMTSDRPYRIAMPPQIARLRLAQAADTQFDTNVVAAFEAYLAVSLKPDVEVRAAALATEVEYSVRASPARARGVA
jgi:putative nucleotidyltransferase with HDIG domain